MGASDSKSQVGRRPSQGTNKKTERRRSTQTQITRHIIDLVDIYDDLLKKDRNYAYESVKDFIEQHHEDINYCNEVSEAFSNTIRVAKYNLYIILTSGRENCLDGCTRTRPSRPCEFALAIRRICRDLGLHWEVHAGSHYLIIWRRHPFADQSWRQTHFSDC